MLRYELGDRAGIKIDSYPVDPDPPTKTREDVKPTILGLSDQGVVLSHPAHDPATQAPPVETRAYFVLVPPGGQAPDLPGSVDEWLLSSLPVSVSVDPVPPEGIAALRLPLPGGLTVPGDYLVQTVLGYDDSTQAPAPA